jgi:uncharacterized damage-inducible protein DinB
MIYSQTTVGQAVEVIQGTPALVREALVALSTEQRRQRPTRDAWSVNEYVWHLRDVYITYTIRLHRTRTENRPSLEPMFNELRARRFGYNQRDAMAALDELQATAVGFCVEVNRTESDQWERTATRLAGESRTARWMVRQVMHESVHHLSDIHTIGDYT